MQQETLTAQSIHIVNALAALIENPPRPTAYLPLRRFPPWTQGPMTVYKAQSQRVASIIQGGGTETRQRRRAIERECFKAGEDPKPFLELLTEKCNAVQ